MLGPDLLAQNDAGVAAWAPAVTSAALLATLLGIPRDTRLGRLWSWIVVLAAAGFAHRALSDYGWWTPRVWPMVVVPIVLISREGALWRLLRSSWPLLRWAAAGLCVALVPAVTVFFEPVHPFQVTLEQLAMYPGIVIAAGCMAYALTQGGHHAE